jgi:hypothetical protein
MRKLVRLAVFGCMVCAPSNSFGSECLPSLPSNDKTVSFPCDTTGIMEGPGGSGMTWNIKAQRAGDSTINECVMDNASKTSSASQFPAANIAISYPSIPDYYIYYKATDAEQYWIGTGMKSGGTTISTVYDVPKLNQKCSMAYGDKFASAYHCTTSSSQYMVTKSGGKIEQTIDGSGTLILPFITLNNVLRSRTVDSHCDTTFLMGTASSVSKTELTTTSWYTSNGNFSFSITTTAMSASSSAMPDQVTNTVYKTVSFSKKAGASIAVLNPALMPRFHSDVRVTGKQLRIGSKCSVRLYASNGQAVRVYKDVSSVDISGLTPGVWLYDVIGQKAMHGKFTCR